MENEKDSARKWAQWSPTLEETNAIDCSSVCAFYFLFCWEAAVSRGVKLPPLVLPDVMQRRSRQEETKSLKYILLPYINTVAVTLLCSLLFIISAPLELWHPMAFTSTKNNLYWSLQYSFPSYVYWTVHHCDSWRIKDQLDVTCYFISLLMCSTCFGH